MAAAFAPQKTVSLMKAAGYTKALARIQHHAESGSSGLVLAASPSVGCSTLLQSFYQSTFRSDHFRIPIYLSVPASGENAADSARRFAHSFLTQVVAFRRREIGLAVTPIGPDEFARLTAIEDVSWTDRALERLNDRPSENQSEMVGRYLSVFSLAESAGLKIIVIFDNVQNSLGLENGSVLLDYLVDLCKRSSFPSVIAGRRRFVASNDDFERVDLQPPTRDEAALFASEESTRSSVKIDEASCDLLAVQFVGRPGFLNAVLKRLAASITHNGFPAIQGHM